MESYPQPVAELAADLRVHFGKLLRRLRDYSRTGELTMSQTSVLGRLERDGPATVTALAKAEGMRSQSMGANVAALEAAGLVRGDPDPTDGRRTLLSLTPECREWVRSRRAAKEDWLAQAIDQQLTPSEQAQLAGAVELIRRLAES